MIFIYCFYSIFFRSFTELNITQLQKCKRICPINLFPLLCLDCLSYQMTEETKGKRVNHKFTPEEDTKLKKLVNSYGESAWDDIANLMEGRNPRQCHDRWMYYLSPSINNSPWTQEEDKRIIKLQKEFKGKWVLMSKKFKGRTDVQLKNRWNYLKKNISQQPKRQTEKPKMQKRVKPIKQPVQQKPTDQLSSPPDIFDQLFNGFRKDDDDFYFGFPV